MCCRSPDPRLASRLARARSGVHKRVHSAGSQHVCPASCSLKGALGNSVSFGVKPLVGGAACSSGSHAVGVRQPLYMAPWPHLLSQLRSCQSNFHRFPHAAAAPSFVADVYTVSTMFTTNFFVVNVGQAEQRAGAIRGCSTWWHWQPNPARSMRYSSLNLKSAHIASLQLLVRPRWCPRWGSNR